MIKSELILKIAEQNPHLYEQDAADIVNTILDTVADALAQGDRVEVRRFGVFTAKRRGARAGRNPRSGAVVAVSEKVVPPFKMSREMLRRLNPGEGVERISRPPAGQPYGLNRPEGPEPPAARVGWFRGPAATPEPPSGRSR